MSIDYFFFLFETFLLFLLLVYSDHHHHRPRFLFFFFFSKEKWTLQYIMYYAITMMMMMKVQIFFFFLFSFLLSFNFGPDLLFSWIDKFELNEKKCMYSVHQSVSPKNNFGFALLCFWFFLVNNKQKLKNWKSIFFVEIFFPCLVLSFFLSNKNWAEKNSIGKSFKFLQWIKIVSLLVIIYHLIKEMIAFHPVNIRVFGGVCVWYHIWYMRIFLFLFFRFVHWP